MLEGPRSVRPRELKSVLRLADSVFRGEGGSIRADYPLLFRRENVTNLLAIFDSGRPVAHLGLCYQHIISDGLKLSVGCTGAVCTRADYRGRGLATQLLEHAFEKMMRDDVDFTIISGERGMYRRAGARSVGRVLEFMLTRSALEPFRNTKLYVDLWKPRYVPRLVGIHDSECVRYVRPERDFRILLQAGLCMNRSADCLVVRRAAKPVAYIVISPTKAGHQVKDSPKEAMAPSVNEYAGDRDAILAGLVAAMDRSSLNELKLPVPEHDAPFIEKLTHAGCEYTIRCQAGTVAVMDFQGFMAKLFWRKAPKNYLCFQERELYNFRLGSQEYRLLGRGKVTQLVFGSEEELAPRIPPGPLGAVLGRRFPVRLPWPGLNFI